MQNGMDQKMGAEPGWSSDDNSVNLESLERRRRLAYEMACYGSRVCPEAVLPEVEQPKAHPV